jgi:hypothetical protein
VLVLVEGLELRLAVALDNISITALAEQMALMLVLPNHLALVVEVVAADEAPQTEMAVMVAVVVIHQAVEAVAETEDLLHLALLEALEELAAMDVVLLLHISNELGQYSHK